VAVDEVAAQLAGGSVTGGSVTGGSATGGSATGGSATGGAATGGAATGGAAAADGAAAPASGRSTTGVSLPSASASREPAAAGGEVEVVVAASDAAGSCSGARFSCAANCSSRVRGAGCRFLRAAARLAGAFRAGGMVSANGMKRIDHNEGSKSRTLHAPCLPTTSTTRCVRCSLKSRPEVQRRHRACLAWKQVIPSGGFAREHYSRRTARGFARRVCGSRTLAKRPAGNTGAQKREKCCAQSVGSITDRGAAARASRSMCENKRRSFSWFTRDRNTPSGAPAAGHRPRFLNFHLTYPISSSDLGGLDFGD